MIGLLYLLLCFAVGWAICTTAFPNLILLVKTDCLKRKISVSPYLLLLPSWYVTGTLALTWATYLTAYLFKNASEPLFYANLIIMPMAFIFTMLVFVLDLKQKKENKIQFFCHDKKVILAELILLLGITALGCILMWTTFFVRNETLYVGVSVFSDFSPHIAMIRSFSYGNNFPTAYPHYAGEDVKYHFMFQFLTGNLEYLGLRIDYAFNIPSIISFVSAFILLYLLAVKITGKIGAGILACLFFAFRSSKTLFTYLSELPEGTGIIKQLTENTDFLSDTPNEDWGLWNLNVYCNQRHLALGLAAIFLVILLFLPHLFEMFEDLKQYHFKKFEKGRKGRAESFIKKSFERIRIIFFTKESWLVKDIRTAVAAGILLGSLSFFHGAAVIGCLLILFIMAVMSKRRLEYLITAVITILMSTLQTKFFIHGSAVSPEILFGFIAENKTIFGVASYLERLLGILPFVLLVVFCLEKGAGRYLLIAFTAPLLFAFTVSLTVDVTVNHKYIMMSCILLGIYAAALVMRILEHRDFLMRAVGVLLIIILTATGIYDFAVVLKKNVPDTAICLEMNDPLTQWVDENSNSQDIFLTSNYTVNQIVFGGAMLYEGWPYYPWSAGYDTGYRTDQVKKMYEAQSPSELVSLIEQNQIRFIVVDRDNRVSTDYILNEDTIKATYELVYREGEGEWITSIYDTQKLLQ